MSDWIGSIKDKISGTGVGYDREIQDRGYRPVVRVISQTSYDDTDLGTKLLIDTVPIDVRMKLKYQKVRDDYADIAGGVGGAMKLASEELHQSAKQIVWNSVGNIKDSVTSGLTGSPASPDDRPLEGIFLDLSVQPVQGFNHAHMIFQNPTATNPKGDEFYGTDLLKVGFPIWLYLGYVDNSGNIVAHPSDPRPQHHIPLVFSGLIAGLQQEINEAGDRMQIYSFGYGWYLKNLPFYSADEIKIPIDTPIETAIKLVFDYLYLDVGPSIPDIIQKAMRLNDTGSTFEPPIRYIYGASSSMKPKKANARGDELDEVVMAVRGQSNFLEMLGQLEKFYNVDIEWDLHGYLTVHGRADPLTRTHDTDGEKLDVIKTPNLETDYGGQLLRVHDVVIGGNVRNMELMVDATGVASALRMRVVPQDSSQSADTMVFTKTQMEEVLADWEAETDFEERLKGVTGGGDEILGGKVSPETDDMFKLFGNAKTLAIDVTQYHEAAPKPVAEPDDTIPADIYGITYVPDKSRHTSPWPDEALQTLFRRVKFWGMRGSAMVIGDANIREADLIRITDIRPKGGVLDLNLDAYKTLTKSLADETKEIRDKLSIQKQRRIRMSISAYENIYFIWKVRHYVGPTGFWTKIWFVKQRDAYQKANPLLRRLMKDPGEED